MRTYLRIAAGVLLIGGSTGCQVVKDLTEYDISTLCEPCGPCSWEHCRVTQEQKEAWHYKLWLKGRAPTPWMPDEE